MREEVSPKTQSPSDISIYFWKAPSPSAAEMIRTSKVGRKSKADFSTSRGKRYQAWRDQSADTPTRPSQHEFLLTRSRQHSMRYSSSCEAFPACSSSFQFGHFSKWLCGKPKPRLPTWLCRFLPRLARFPSGKLSTSF